jgi:hypothetical protein
MFGVPAMGALALIITVAAPSESQMYGNGDPPRAGTRVVEEHSWSSHEGRLMAYYSAALAFSPVGAPRPAGVRGASIGIELSYLPALSEAQRSAGYTKAQSTNLAPVVPRPRISVALPAGFSLEGSWIPPIRVFGVKANLLSGAVSRSFTAPGGFSLTPRIAGTIGSVKGPITCNDELQERGGGDAVYFTYVCHGTESEDSFEPSALSGELIASRTIRRGTIAPYAGFGVRLERDRFDVGVRFPDGSTDPNHSILELDLTRGYGFLGATWAGPRRSAVSAELFYAPGSLVTGRVQASLQLFGS